MIFLTVGTQLPFDRLVKVVDEWNNGQDPNRVFVKLPTGAKEAMTH